jgi:hypothetical protein
VVNDNFHAGGPRVPSESDDPARRLRRSRGWRDLRVGDLVRANRRRGADPPGRRGRIMGIDGETARVRWEDRSETPFPLSYLVNV